MTSAALCVKSAFEALSTGNLVEAASMFVEASTSPDIDTVLKDFMLFVAENQKAIDDQEQSADDAPQTVEVMSEPVLNYHKQRSLAQIILAKDRETDIPPASKSAPSLGHLPGHNFYEDLFDEDKYTDLVQLSASSLLPQVFISDHAVDTGDHGFLEEIPGSSAYDAVDDVWIDAVDEEPKDPNEVDPIDEAEEQEEEPSEEQIDSMTGEDPSELE
jgi:hypothetical protein